jgi:hypothetical protein
LKDEASLLCRSLIARTVVCMGLAVCTTALPASAQSGVGSIAAEATIYEDAAGNNGGGFSSVCIGNHATTATRRGYVRYDLPSIPAGSVVTRVVLTFVQDRVRTQGIGSPKTATLELRRVAASWTEGTGAASLAACGAGANVSGIDWTGAPTVTGADSGVENLPTTSGVTISFDTDVGTNDDGLIGDVQTWVEGASNDGWRMRVAEESILDNARLMSPGSLTVYWTESGSGVPALSPPGLFTLAVSLCLAALPLASRLHRSRNRSKS